MNNIIKVKYDNDSHKTEISCDEIIFDTSRINDMNISEWVYPFVIKNNKWYGFYEEMKIFCQSDSFEVIFYGSNNDMNILKSALVSTNINVIGLNNKVVILYNSEQLVTKITVNGKIFDTSKIANRSIDEWIFPFTFKDIEWKGIFKEIESFLGINSYSIQFIGCFEDMRIIMDNCPQNVDITYKTPVVPKKKTQPVVSKSANTNSTNDSAELKQENQYQKPVLKDIKGNTKGLINEAKIDYQKMQEKDSGLLMFGKIAVIIVVICCIVFTVFMSRFLMILSVIPAIVFCVLAFTKDYKKLAVCTFIVCILCVIISWIIITVRWNIALKEINDTFDDINNNFDDMNDIFNQANDVLNGVNDALSGN